MWKILDGIPVIGHVKGVVHYVTGDVEAGNRAMKESTRSSVVIGAGAAGFVAGPAGSMALGALAGTAWDSVESAATGEAAGLIAGVENIVTTASRGEVPVVGILQTSLTVTGDLLGGLGGGSIVSSVTKTTGQVVTKSVGQSVGKSVGASAGETILKSASVPAGSIVSSVTKTTGQVVTKSVGQSVGKSVGASAGETILKSASVPAGETFGKAVVQSVGKSAGQTATKTMAKQVAKTVILEETVTLATYGTARAVATETEKTFQTPTTPFGSQGSRGGGSTGTGSSTRPSGEATGAASGESGRGDRQDPPREPTRHTPSTQEPEPEPDTQAFLFREFARLFGVQSIDQICIRGEMIFGGLNRRSRSLLESLIRYLIDKGFLARVVEIIRNVFETVEPGQITFLNFISLSEFISQFLSEQMSHRNALERLRQQNPTSYEERRNAVVEIVGRQLSQHDYTIVRVFREIRAAMERRSLPVTFRDIFAAVYHYFKHRVVDGYEMSVGEYFDIITDNLTIILNTQEYDDVVRRGRGLTYIRYYAHYGRRLLMKLARYGTRVVLSTAFFCDDTYDGDEDGDIYINGTRRYL